MMGLQREEPLPGLNEFPDLLDRRVTPPLCFLGALLQALLEDDDRRVAGSNEGV